MLDVAGVLIGRCMFFDYKFLFPISPDKFVLNSFLSHQRICSVPLKCTIDIPLIISMSDILQVFTSPHRSVLVAILERKHFNNCWDKQELKVISICSPNHIVQFYLQNLSVQYFHFIFTIFHRVKITIRFWGFLFEFKGFLWKKMHIYLSIFSIS